MDWEKQEGTGARFNPLATERYEPGSTRFNQAGVRNYSSLSSGFAATLATLRNGDYGSILGALSKGAGTNFGGTVGASSWGTSAFQVVYLNVAPSAHEAQTIDALIARAT